uniref:Uncharacterized protein n=1 Tax=Trichobilharzia regenti TaxID=157069 RepID=A0AA85KFD0_TRIRE|nr:unnamed protein product [Trichobilharzia regenti]
MDSKSGQEESDTNSQPAKVTKSMNDLTNELGDILIDDLGLDDDFDCVSSHGMTREFLLVLDKKFMPKFNEGDLQCAKRPWVQFAATAAAYVYKSVGQCVSEPLRVWLSNVASSAILYGLLGELATPGTAGTDEGTRSSGEATTENLSLPDICLDDGQDGYWYYGSWTVDNVANS